MGSYRLTQAAKEDLRQIYFYRFETWGEAAADQYYNHLFDRFEQIAAQPYLYPSVDFIRQGYRRSYVVCRASITALKTMWLKSWQSLEAKILTHLLNFETTFLYHLLKLGVSAILGQGSTDDADEKMDLVDAVGADDSHCGKL